MKKIGMTIIKDINVEYGYMAAKPSHVYEYVYMHICIFMRIYVYVYVYMSIHLYM
jgi:hypothetical protein